ncbi:MAG: MBL fold metallo-hydrolase [Actinomycetes bacterium]
MLHVQAAVRGAVVAATVVAVATVPLAAGAPAQEPAATRVPIASFTPLPATDPADVDPDVAALRDELIGPSWRDPDTVSLSWVGVSSFIGAVRGHVFLFDAWEIIGAVEDYLPIGREELAALAPEAIMVGHGHFDHAGDLGYVAGLAGSVVVGSEEHCVVAEEGATREGVGLDFTCAVTGTASTPAAGELQQLRLWEDVAPVTIMRHVHSAARPPSEDNRPDPFVPVMDPQPYLDHLAGDPEELGRFLAQQDESNEGGVWLYHLAVDDFTLLWGNSAGPVFEAPEVTAALDTFPGCVDVMSNAILGFDQPVSGLQDPRLYIEAVHPAVFLPSHADAWAPVISAGQAQYVDEFTAQMALLEDPPEVDFLLDPEDYLVTRTWDVTDPRWSVPPPGSSCATAAGGGGGIAAPAPDDDDATAGATDDRGGLPATGGGLALAAGAALAGGVLAGRRRN